jgi:GNAT superfamily N-acetyltransferase
MAVVSTRIRDVDPLGADAMALLHEAARDARALYPELFTADSPPPTNRPLVDLSAYVIAYVDDLPLACGAIVPYEGEVAEVRRMYVHRDCRRQGLADAVLTHLLHRAREFGYRRVVLETGYKQEPAQRFYESKGFRRTAPFGKHVDDPTSVCYELVL